MRDLLPVALVVCLLLAVALAAAVGVVYWLSFAVGPPTAPPGKFLVYEIDPTWTADPASVDMPRLIAAINQRINPGWSRNARIQPLENRLIEVAVFGDDQEKVRHIERLLDEGDVLPAAIRKAESSMDEVQPEKATEEPTPEAENAP